MLVSGHSKARLFFRNKFEIMAKRNSMCLPDLSTILLCYQFVAVVGRPTISTEGYLRGEFRIWHLSKRDGQILYGWATRKYIIQSACLSEKDLPIEDEELLSYTSLISIVRCLLMLSDDDSALYSFPILLINRSSTSGRHSINIF